MGKKSLVFLILGIFALSFAMHMVSADFYEDLGAKLGSDQKTIILGIIIIAIIFAGMFDILTLVPFFTTPWVKYLIAAGISIAAILLEWPAAISYWGLGLAASFGAAGIFLVIILAVVIFVIAAFAGSKVKIMAARRKAIEDEAAIMRESGNIVGAGRLLRDFGSEIKKQKKR